MEADEPVRRILHCDMDCFYAAVHVRDDPELAGRPVVVGGAPGGRGVVAAANYEARAFGIHSAMPSSRAQRLCADLVFLRPDFARYRRESAQIFNIFRRFTPLLQTLSLDEAFLDVSQHLERFGHATAVAQAIRRRVAAERRLTVSIGVGPNRLVAKIASDQDKPDGLTVVPPRRVLEFLEPLSVRRLPGVGPATEAALQRIGVRTVRELRKRSQEELRDRFGRHGQGLYRYCRGIDERPVRLHRERKSLSTERTYSEDLSSRDEMEAELERLAGQVAVGLERRGLSASTVTIKVRYSDFTTLSRSRTLRGPTRSATVLALNARELLGRSEAGRRSVRLLGVGVSNLVRGAPSQLSLFDS